MRVIEKAVDGRLSVREAAGLLQRSERQVQRLKHRFRPDSANWVRHGNRGKPRSWALPPDLRQHVLKLATGKYAGFNDSHLRQKLVEKEGLSLSRESVRRILRKAKRPSPQKRRPRQYRARRPRRPRFGLMLLPGQQPEEQEEEVRLVARVGAFEDDREDDEVDQRHRERVDDLYM